MCPILGTNASSKNVASASQEDMWGIDYEMSQTYRLRGVENQNRVVWLPGQCQPDLRTLLLRKDTAMEEMLREALLPAMQEN